MYSVSRYRNTLHLLVTLPWAIVGCAGNLGYKDEIVHTLSLPHTVAILMSEEQGVLFANETLMQSAYDRLESKTWEVLTRQAGVRVLERRNLEVVRTEQHLQRRYAMDEESAVRIGRLVGAQGVLVYRIRLPSWRDRFLVDEQYLPITIGGRLLEVETGTVLWSQSVTISPSNCESGNCWFGGKPQATLWPTLQQGIDQLVEQFSKVVPCRHSC